MTNNIVDKKVAKKVAEKKEVFLKKELKKVVSKVNRLKGGGHTIYIPSTVVEAAQLLKDEKLVFDINSKKELRIRRLTPKELEILSMED